MAGCCSSSLRALPVATAGGTSNMATRTYVLHPWRHIPPSTNLHIPLFLSPLLRRLGVLALAASLAGCEADSVTGVIACATTTDAADQAARSTASADVAAVVAAAQAFQATLTTAQQTTLTVALTTGNADNWSNLPCGAQCRNGLQFGSLSAAQQAAALVVADAALSDAGYGTLQGIRAADEYLGQNGGGNGYDSDIYFIAFVGTPSTTDPWILQLGGHHLAINIGYEGSVSSPTPFFVGVEPLSFTLNGTTYAPMQERAATTTGLLDALSTTELASARLSSSFSDVLLGPGQDFTFPAQVGLNVGSLTAAQQALVVDAIEAWVQDADDDTASDLLAEYTSAEALASTFVSYATNPDLTTQGSYIRIDGPRVWIEIVAQTGVVFRNQVHYHSIWRDKTLDYGGVFNTTTGTEEDPTDC